MRYKSLPSTEELLKKHLFIGLYGTGRYHPKNLSELCEKYAVTADFEYYTDTIINTLLSTKKDKFEVYRWTGKLPFDNITVNISRLYEYGPDFIKVKYDFTKSSDFIDGYTIYLNIIIPKDFKKYKSILRARLMHRLIFALDYIPFTQSDIHFIRPTYYFDWNSLIYRRTKYTDTIMNIGSFMTVISPLNKSRDYFEQMLSSTSDFKKSYTISKDVDYLYSMISSTDVYSIVNSIQGQIDSLKSYDKVQKSAVVRFCREEKVGFSSTTAIYKYSISAYFLYRERLFIDLSTAISDKYRNRNHIDKCHMFIIQSKRTEKA